jgi:hypothetical protein
MLAACSTPSRRPQTILPRDDDVAALNLQANNPANDRAERARAIFTLFAWHIPPNASAGRVHEVLTDTTWLRKTRLYEINLLSGWVPIEVNVKDTMFCLHLFPADAAKESSPWVIYFRLTGKLQQEDALEFLRGETVAGNPKLAEFALCSPNSKNPTGLPGRIESFSKQGLRVLDEW